MSAAAAIVPVAAVGFPPTTSVPASAGGI
jgi:hypothetical protein